MKWMQSMMPYIKIVIVEHLHYFFNGCYWKSCIYALVFDLGSRGPSTVTLMALLYVATCGGQELTIIDSVKLLPGTSIKYLYFSCYLAAVDIFKLYIITFNSCK